MAADVGEELDRRGGHDGDAERHRAEGDEGRPHRRGVGGSLELLAVDQQEGQDHPGDQRLLDVGSSHHVEEDGAAEQGQARIFRTDDAGRSWTQVYETNLKGVFLDALAFWDERHGIALSDPVDGTPFLLVTDDGGLHWTRVPPSALPPVLAGEGAFAASGTCLVVWGASDVWIGTGGAAAARVFHSSDRGRTSSASDTPVHAGNAASGIFALAFRDATHGVAVGGDYSKPREETANVAITDDGGRTWRLAKGPLVAAYLSGVSYDVADTLLAVGLAGTAVSRDDGESWVAVDTLPLNAVRFGSHDFGIAAGPRGRLARWVSARERW